MQPVGEDSSHLNKSPSAAALHVWGNLQQPCTADTRSAIQLLPSQGHKPKLWFPAQAHSPSRGRSVLQHLVVCLPCILKVLRLPFWGIEARMPEQS